ASSAAPCCARWANRAAPRAPARLPLPPQHRLAGLRPQSFRVARDQQSPPPAAPRRRARPSSAATLWNRRRRTTQATAAYLQRLLPGPRSSRDRAALPRSCRRTGDRARFALRQLTHRRARTRIALRLTERRARIVSAAEPRERHSEARIGFRHARTA